MSAEVLREAATKIRAEWDDNGPRPMGTAWHQERDFHLAVADWIIQVATARESLDAVAKAKSEPLGTGSDMFLAQERHALAVARAYLGIDQ